MEVLGSDKGSDFITNFDFVPPSPPPLDSVFDYPSPAFDIAPITSPPLPHTSSYNGSYNSPFSQHSELSFSGDDIHLQDFPGPMNEYEPSDYDAPNQPSLLMFTNDYDSEYMSPHLKHQSPPRLLMPDDHQQQQQQQQNVPIINVPLGDEDMMNGPQLCIVPATPIGGGDAAGRTNVPFQSTLSSLNHGSEPAPSQQSSEQHQRQRDSSPSRFPGPEEKSAVASSSRSTPSNANTFIFPPNDYPQQQHQQQQPRSRTHSDPWTPNFLTTTLDLEKMNVGNGGYDFSRQQLQSFTFGGASSSSNNGNGFLSPDSVRRSTSDASRHHRHSRSEDTRSPQMAYGNSNNTSGPGYHHHQQSHSMGGNTAASTTFLFPPIVDFHTGQQQQPQNLHPNLLNPATPPAAHQQPHHLHLLSSASNPNLALSSSSGIGHFRRASSGTRSGRGAEVWGSLGTQGHHAMTPRRMSPYPSPNASPRYGDLELDPDLSLAGDNKNGGGMGLGMGMGLGDFPEDVVLSRRGSRAGLDGGGGGSQKAESVVSGGGSQSRQRSNVPSASDALPSQIPKVNVTTGRTANASHRRRKQDANFACTVPGCGSTFTRGFNLKGHMRSHFEEKPYKCQWPGCGKGFARQHDCKRHEQLHSNFRPFECEGCRKQFARMDALNRHLRSEAGVECARIVEKGKGAGDMEYDDSVGGVVEKSEDQKHHLIPKRRQSSGGGGGGADSWSGVAL